MDDSVTLTREESGAEIARGPDAVNTALRGTGIWVAPRDFSAEPPSILALLRKPTLSADENAKVKAHFVLSRQECLDIIQKAGRKPHHPTGGSLRALSLENEIQYPQLWVIEEGADGSAYFPLHVNVSDDGVPSDEVGQVLSGRLMRYRFKLDDGIVVLTMSCPGHDRGWMFSFDGARPHGGILHETEPGSKILVQVLGPETFRSRPVQ
ncbi:MAG: hypothetical protein AAFW98_02985 [Pseudomonadota bacterium]